MSLSLVSAPKQGVFPLLNSPMPGRLPEANRVANYTPRPVPRDLPSVLCDASRVIFLDVETTGLSRYYDDLTLVGYEVDGRYCVHIAGDDPSELLAALRMADTLVTFNGTLFDIPFLLKSFAGIALPRAHLDLRYAGRRVGLTGGQKEIERQIGVSRGDSIENMDGAVAVLLWHEYLRGDRSALRRLIAYNRADVLGMCAILDHVVERSQAHQDLFLETPRFSDRAREPMGWARLDSSLPDAQRLGRSPHTFSGLFEGTIAETATIVGIDLTGSEARPSGCCVLRGNQAETSMLGSDDDIVALVLASNPALVSIDSPLSLPKGRSRVEDDDPGRRQYGIMRICERILKRRGINVYPCLLPSMQGLTRRGMALADRLRAYGIPVIESYPGAAQDIIGIPRKGAGEAFLKQGLAGFGLRGEFETKPVKHDELDAITSALVGHFFLAGKYEALEGEQEGALIIPDLAALPGPLVVGISGRISAGKTTTAGIFEKNGFAYTRFSLAVDDEILSRGGKPDRRSRQLVGQEINETKGQRWLCERVLARVGDYPLIVVDGLRFVEDRAFFIERFGSRFLHVHITAPTELRKRRYRRNSRADPSFKDADAQPVEGEVDQLGGMAVMMVENATTIDALNEMVKTIIQTFVQKGGEECRSRSS